MAEDTKRLRRQRGLATALLALMAGLMLASLRIPPDWGHGWVAGLLLAAAKAGLVGGIADWFAVTALFRHPLGLPIPHTAILPAQQQRLGHALGRFVSDHVFTETELSAALARLDLPGMAARLLADPAMSAPAAQGLARLLPRLLATVEDDRARRLVARYAGKLLSGPGAGQVVARALRGLMRNNRHQEMLSFVLAQLREALAAREEELKGVVAQRVREQGGRLIGWAVGASVASRVITAVNTELDRIGPDDSALREAFDHWVETEIDRMETDPARAAEIGRALGHAVSGDVVRGWIWDLWARLRVALEQDVARSHGRTAAFLESAIQRGGQLLETDPALRAGLDRALAGILQTVLPAARARLAEFIGRVVAGWDSRTLVARLEARVGPDLQWVRINGTMVGFLVGGALYALLRAGFGVRGL